MTARKTTKKKAPRCAWCLGPVEVLPIGRPPIYCQGSCRRAAYRDRTRANEANKRAAAKMRRMARQIAAMHEGRPEWRKTLTVAEQALLGQAEAIEPTRLPIK